MKQNQEQLFNTLLNQEQKHQSLSKNYMLVPTKEVFAMMENRGFDAKIVRAVNTSKVDKRGFQKHLFEITPNQSLLQNEDQMRMRIYGENSYDGSSSLRFEGGLLRQVCSNGLKMSFNIFEPVRIVHRKINENTLEEALNRCVSQFDNVNNVIKEMQSYELTDNQAMEYAQSIFQIRTNTTNPENILEGEFAKLLEVNRESEKDKTAWNVLNTVQENLFSWDNAKELLIRAKSKKEGEEFTTRKIRRLASHGDVSNMVNQAIFSEMLKKMEYEPV